MSPVPKISKDAPLKIEESKEEVYNESSTEKKGKLIFWAGVIFAVIILISTWIVFAYWATTYID